MSWPCLLVVVAFLGIAGTLALLATSREPGRWMRGGTKRW